MWCAREAATESGRPLCGDRARVWPNAAVPSLRLRTMSVETITLKWMCVTCGWIYDPAIGDPDGGIPPGTPFEEISEDWFCPVCGACPKDFELIDE